MLRLQSAAVYLLSFACALLFILQFTDWPSPFVLHLEIQNDQLAHLELVHEQGSARQRGPVVRMVAGKAAFQSIAFPITEPQVRELSLLDQNRSTSFSLRHAYLQIFGRKSLQIPVGQIRSGDVGTIVTRENDTAKISHRSGITKLKLVLPSRIQESRASRVLHGGIVAGIFGIAFALLWLTARQPEASTSISARGHRIIRNGVVVFLIAAYGVASVAQLNGSATALWRRLNDRGVPNEGILLGTPKPIRSDEWIGQTPWILSQVSRPARFAVENPGVGEGVMPLLNNLPVRHWTVMFRPQMWAFFIADLERAFAFYWNFKWFGLLLGAFLFLQAITRQNSVVAALGVLLLFFSPFVQWWFSTPTAMPEMLGGFFLALWSVALIRCTKSRWTMLGAAILLVASIAQFIFCAYPRFQIPLIYLAVFLLTGALFRHRPQLQPDSNSKSRSAALGIAGVIALLIVLGWYHDFSSTLHRIRALAYPGQYSTTGGGLPWQGFFMRSLDFTINDQIFPANQMNVCEAAGFLFLAPLIAAVCLLDLIQKRNDSIIAANLIFIAVGVWFMLLGFPACLVKVSGFSLVYPQRVILAVSIASIITLCRYLSRSKQPSVKTSDAIPFLMFGVLFVALFAVFQNTRHLLGENFIDTWGVASSAIFFSLVFAMLWRRQVVSAGLLVLIPMIYTTALVNPIGRGLPGFTRSAVFRWLASVERQQPQSKWLVIGPRSGRSAYLAQFVKATGADTLGGYRCEPDQEMVRALDPLHNYSSVYNRYAKIRCVASEQREPSFELAFINRYDVLIPPRTEILDKLNVTFVLEVDLPADAGRIEKFSVVGERLGLRLLKRESL